jgi:methanogenic corrinoid protein MtbC1
MAASKFDERGLEAILDDMFARGSFEQVATELVMPALVALGDGWQDGRVDVAAEHAAAGAVQRRLGAAFLAAGRPGDDKDVVLVGMPPGARHELGALAFATTARRAGIGVRYLGPDLPLQDWLDATARTSAAAAAIGVVVASDVDPAERVGRALRAAAPQMVIAFGGRAAADVDRTGAAPALVLPHDLSSAVDVLRLELARRSVVTRDR